MKEQRILEEHGTTTPIPDVPVSVILCLMLLKEINAFVTVGDIPSHLYSLSFELNPSNVHNV